MSDATLHTRPGSPETPPAGERYWFMFHGDDILLIRDNKTGNFVIPRSEGTPAPASTDGLSGALPGVRLGSQALSSPYPIGEMDGLPCVACAAPLMPEGREWKALDLRSAYSRFNRETRDLIGRGYQLVHWDARSRFCSRCGAPCVAEGPASKRCSECNEQFFPQIALAVLVLVHRENSILLVRSRNFKGRYYSCISGYLEPGETLERCVRREVYEETRLLIDEVKYFASQPWPFPSLLMAGYTAGYLDGKIKLQDSELCDGGFFPRDHLPPLPPTFTLARKMIDAWVNGET